jgi:predicted Zn-dependent peptidase
MYEITRLPNGLTVATMEMPHMASVSLGVWVGVGGRYEPAAISGASHFIEHLLFKGTRTRSAREISQAVEGIGGYLNAFTSEENTCFYAKARHDHFDVLLEVLTDMFLHSVFDPQEMEKERGVIKEELAMSLDQPAQHVQELLNEIQWPDQPLGRPLTGSDQTIESITREQLRAYQKRNYVAATTVVAAAGHLAPTRVLKAVADVLSGFRAGAKPRYQPVTWSQRAPVVRLVTKPVEQTQIALGVRTCSRHDERRYGLRLLNAILGENMSSRLFQHIREDHGLAYNIYSSLSFFDDIGDLVVSAGLETKNLAKTLTLVAEDLKEMTEKPPGAAEFSRARDYVIGQIDLSLENTESHMMWMGEQLLGYGDILPPERVKQRLAAVTPAEVMAIAREFLRPERFNLALVSPLKKDRGLARHLTW